MRAFLVLMVIHSIAAAQTLLLETTPTVPVHSTVTMQLTGTMKFDRNNRIETMPLQANCRQVLLIQQSQRKYLEANSATVAGLDRGERSLPDKHRLIVVDRDGPYSPAGPLNRDELSLVAEHFDPSLAPSLLSGTAINIGDTWTIPDTLAGSLCLFEGVLKNTLQGKLETVENSIATFTVSGAIEGLENGAKVKITVTAKGQFDIAAKLLTTLTWEQADEREQGPVSPAMEAKATVNVTRKPATEPLDAVPEISDASKRAMLHRLVHRSSNYELLYDRDWHTVVQTDTHLVLRLVQKGELIAQATLTPWKASGTNRDDAVKEFLAATLKQPGWVPDKVLSSAAAPAEAGRMLYRHVVQGKQDDIAVVQSFHLITAADGRQVVVSCVARPELLEKLGSHDAALAAAIDFPATK